MFGGHEPILKIPEDKEQRILIIFKTITILLTITVCSILFGWAGMVASMIGLWAGMRVMNVESGS